MNSTTKIYNALNVNAITSLLAAYGSGFALFDSRVLPDDCGDHDSTINFYMSQPKNYALSADIDYFAINCRSEDQYKSLLIAETVIATINRKGISDYFITCQMLPQIPPLDDTDNFNTPIECIIKNR